MLQVVSTDNNFEIMAAYLGSFADKLPTSKTVKAEHMDLEFFWIKSRPHLALTLATCLPGCLRQAGQGVPSERLWGQHEGETEERGQLSKGCSSKLICYTPQLWTPSGAHLAVVLIG